MIVFNKPGVLKYGFKHLIATPWQAPSLWCGSSPSLWVNVVISGSARALKYRSSPGQDFYRRNYRRYTLVKSTPQKKAVASRYQDRSVAFLTQHGKEALLGKAFATTLRCKLVRAAGFDTDQLGTFSREIERPDTQLRTARTKARIGMDILGLPVGIASEGAFSLDPYTGLMPWNIEMLVWQDDELAHEIVGVAQGPARSVQATARTIEDVLRLVEQAGFPEHQLTMRPNNERDRRVRKGIATMEALQQTFAECISESTQGSVFVESDLRAFCNPTRQAMISRAAEDLMRKITSHCPNCGTPGYAVTEHRPGLPCAVCHTPTKLALASIWRCGKCSYSHEEKADKEHFADPSRCDYCNP